MNAAQLEAVYRELQEMEPILLRIGGPEAFDIVRGLQRLLAHQADSLDAGQLTNIRRLSTVLASKFQGEAARVIREEGLE